MREGHTYRGWRRQAARDTFVGGVLGDTMERFDTFKRKSKRAALFEELGKDVTQYYTTARNLLMTGERAQMPQFRAIIKTMKAIAKSPKIRHPSLNLDIPVLIQTARHMRGSWRSL